MALVCVSVVSVPMAFAAKKPATTPKAKTAAAPKKGASPARAKSAGKPTSHTAKAAVSRKASGKADARSARRAPVGKGSRSASTRTSRGRGRERIVRHERRSRGRHHAQVARAQAESAESDSTAGDELDAPAAAAAEPAGGSVDQHVQLRQGETLESVLTAHGVSADEAQQWAEKAEEAYDLRRFYPRKGLTLRFDKDSRALERVLYEIDDKGKLVLEQTASGIQASQQGLPYYIEVRGTASKISRTLRDDAARVGVPDRIVTQLGEIFGWEADAEAEGQFDEFRVLYENIWRAGYTYPETGKLLAAELYRNGQRSSVVYFQDADGTSGYYRPTGEAMSRAFLRYPVEFTEITSGFGWRYHPILHVGRPHKGVDFAAPTGTEVHAASDGRVVKAGWGRGFGRHVKIEHLEGYVSTYGHLSGIADGISEGSIVERGQIIGYVGATGLATGPHLHYEVERWGEAVDPLEMTALPEQPVQEANRPAFDQASSSAAKQMAVLPVDESTRILAGTAVAAPSAAYEAE